MTSEMGAPVAPEPTSDSLATPPKDQESRLIHRCEVSTRDGKICGRYVGTVYYDHAWRCPSHRPRAKDPAQAAPSPNASPPPVKSLKRPTDALRLASWAALEMSAGHITPQRCAQTVTACREFRLAWAQQNNGDLLVAAINKALHAIVAWSEAHGEGRREALSEATAAVRALMEEWQAVLKRAT